MTDQSDELTWQTSDLPLPQLDDAVPPKVRTIAYVSSLGVGAVAFTIKGTVAVLLANELVSATTAQVSIGLAGVATGVVALVVGGLGTIYRPTK